MRGRRSGIDVSTRDSLCLTTAFLVFFVFFFFEKKVFFVLFSKLPSLLLYWSVCVAVKNVGHIGLKTSAILGYFCIGRFVLFLYFFFGGKGKVKL